MNPFPAPAQEPQQNEQLNAVGEVLTETTVDAASTLIGTGVETMQQVGTEAAQVIGEAGVDIGIDIGAELVAVLGELFS